MQALGGRPRGRPRRHHQGGALDLLRRPHARAGDEERSYRRPRIPRVSGSPAPQGRKYRRRWIRWTWSSRSCTVHTGEDGTIQGMLELAGIPYVGSGVLASAVGMDKLTMKKIFAHHDLPQVEWLGFTRKDWEKATGTDRSAIETALGYPCFVKPANLGSSVGIGKADRRRGAGARPRRGGRAGPALDRRGRRGRPGDRGLGSRQREGRRLRTR